MKLLPLILFAFILASCTSTKKEVGPLHHKKVMILGNSITQNGQYVGFIEYYLRKNYPHEKLDIISIGLSSETVNGASEDDHPFPRPCIHSRIDSALAKIKPDVVMACYGMNDGLFSNWDEGRFDAYKKGIQELKMKVENSGASLILSTPTIFDSEIVKYKTSKDGERHSYKAPYYKYNEVLGKFADWLLSQKSEQVPVIDLHHYLNPILAKTKALREDSTFIPDGVHPDKAGHFLMAKKILMDLYPEVEVGEPYPTIHQLKKDSLYLYVSERRKLRSKGWMEYVGYTRGKVVKLDDIEPTQLRVEELDIKIKEWLKNN
ncbi:SGNH/GDSL hydrolase family protein [Labilibacter marinus]|uniref:SGNH/GDSL hydrolase family protein n=1 Tax=Labilibacter marinus TaxID=1477105 RepID=UPI000834D40D|nr:SGNH/GDSL hydrolase family protein [Labilibacter marinus]